MPLPHPVRGRTGQTVRLSLKERQTVAIKARAAEIPSLLTWQTQSPGVFLSVLNLVSSRVTLSLWACMWKGI